MAENKKIIIEVDTKVDDKDLDKVSGNVKKIGDGASKAKKGLDGMSDGAKKLTTSFKEVTKAMGFIKLLEMLKDVFMQNQKVMDLVATAMGAINIVFNQIVDVITKVVEKVGALTNGFEGTTKVIKGVFGIALDSLKLQFYSIKLVIQELQLAWENSFFGGKDPAKIKELGDKIDETKGKIKETGEDIIKNGKQVVDNAGKMVNEFGQVVEGIVDGVSKIDPSKALDQSKALVAALKAAKMATAQLGGVVAEYERKEEKLRQTRDDATKSIKERIEASDKLKGIIKDESKAQLELVNLNIKVAQLNYNINKSDENAVALRVAKNKVKEVESQIEGKVTEQKMAGIAITKEQVDLDKSVIKGAQDRTTKQLEFSQSLMDDNVAKLEQQKANLETLKTTELVYLKDNIDRYKEGTQARVDAEQEYANRKQEIDNQIVATDKAIVDKNKALYKKSLDDTLAALQANLDDINRTNVLGYNIKKNLIEKAWKEQKKILEVAYEEEKKLAGDNLEALIALKKKYDAQVKKADDDKRQQDIDNFTKQVNQYKEYANQVLGIATDIGAIFDNLANHKIAQLDRENAALEKQTSKQAEELDRQRAQEDANIEASNMSAEQKAAAHKALEGRTIAEKNANEKKKFEIELANFNATEKLKKQAFNRNKAFQIAGAVINTAAGITMALGTMPPPYSFVEAALVGAAGIAQIAKIASTTYEGGTPPELNTLYASPSTATTPSSSGPSAGATGNLGQSQLKLQNDQFKYMKVQVAQGDIRDTIGKVELIENRSKH